MIGIDKSIITDIENPEPDIYDVAMDKLGVIYPNPFNSSTTIDYYIYNPGYANLCIFNILGQEVRELSSGYHLMGHYQYTWDSSDKRGISVASGIYFVSLITSDSVYSKTLLLLK